MSLALKIWLIVFYTISIIAVIGICVFLYFKEFWVGIGITAFLIFIGIRIWLIQKD